MTGEFNPACPLPMDVVRDAITLAHGEGGRMMRELLASDILPTFDNTYLASHGDAAVLPELNGLPVFTTDSFVVTPRFFPGGNIGSLAVFGTVNDLAVAGARPRWLSLGLIIEEGFSLVELQRILASIAQAAHETGVLIVTGDTKVLPRGAVDGLLINTSGLGELVFPMSGPATLEAGDEILVSGPIARHGMAVLAARESLGFEPPIETDSAPLFSVVDALREAGIPVKAMRDATRGGVAAVLHEWASESSHSFAIESHDVPVTPAVRGACELLGLDPLHVACEGTMVLAVPPSHSQNALAAMQCVSIAAGAARIAEVIPHAPAAVLVNRALRRRIPLDEPAGAPLPRIC